MECFQEALKSGAEREMAARLSPQSVSDDLMGVNAVQNGASVDDFVVDDLLDLPNDDDDDVMVEGEQNREGEAEGETKVPEPNTQLLNNEEFASEPESGLTVPEDDLANLEWLSHFVEDSFSESYLAGVLPETPKWLTGKPEKTVTPPAEQPAFKTPVHTKARTKRARTGGRVWSLGSPSLSDTSSSSTSSSSISNPSLGGSDLVEPVSRPQPPANRQKRETKPKTDPLSGQRRCSHCGVTKTPQWRAGPMGPKTLCNACGVRFKSGRLFPEYRPACSPTFSSELHSNHHRKVMEMRRKKESGSLLEQPASAAP